MRLPDRDRQARENRFANPIVVGVQFAAFVAAREAEKSLADQRIHGGWVVPAHAGRGVGCFPGQRPPRRRDQLDQHTPFIRQGLDAVPDQFIKAHGRCVFPAWIPAAIGLAAKMLGEFDHKQRASPRLARHRGSNVDVGPAFTQGPQGQFLGVLARQRPNLQRTSTRHHVRREIGVLAMEQSLQARTGMQILAAVRRDQQARRCIGRAKQFRQQGHAVEVSPLQIVDEEHEREPAAERAQPREEFAERAERLGATFLGRDAASGWPRRRKDLAKDRKDLAEGVGVQRRESANFEAGKALQTPAEGGGQRLERLVRGKDAFVTPTAQHLSPPAPFQVLQKRSDDFGLAHSRATRNEHQLRRPLLVRLVERCGQLRQLRMAADELETAGSRQCGRLAAQHGPDRLDLGSLPGIGIQQRQTQGPQVGGGSRLRRCGRSLELQIEQFIGISRGERQVARQTLIQQHADAVPVGGGCQRLAPLLFRRHVGQRSHRGPGNAGQMEAFLRHVSRQPEVENLHPPGVGDEHVGGFDVAVHIARAMHEIEALHQLAEGGSQPVFAQLRRPVLGCRADPMQEIGPLDQLHRQTGQGTLRHQLVDPHEVVVPQLNQGVKLADKTRQRRSGVAPQRLKCHPRAAVGQVCFVDLAHTATADLADQPVGADVRGRGSGGLTRRKGRCDRGCLRIADRRRGQCVGRNRGPVRRHRGRRRGIPGDSRLAGDSASHFDRGCRIHAHSPTSRIVATGLQINVFRRTPVGASRRGDRVTARQTCATRYYRRSHD